MATDKKFSDWVTSLPVAQVAAGDLLPIVQGGVSKQAQAGVANGLETLDNFGIPKGLKPIRFNLAAGTTVRLNNADGLIGKGGLIVVCDGNSPAPIGLNIYRLGTYNTCKAWANDTGDWSVGNLADPGTGAFRVYVDGQTASADLVFVNTVTYGRNIRIYQFHAM